MKKFIIGIVLVNSIILGYTAYNKSTRNHQGGEVSFTQTEIDGILLGKPLQYDLTENDPKVLKKNISNKEFVITPVKNYKIAARILKRKAYSSGNFHEVLPLDLALGWGIMSNPQTITENKISISQSNRFYFWKIPNFNGIPRSDIEKNSANVHISPMDESLEKGLKSLSEDDLVFLEGYLVNIDDRTRQMKMASSLTRNDTGAGACEVFLVTAFKKLEG